MQEVGCQKITLGITGVKRPIGDPLRMDSLLSPGIPYRSPVVSRFEKLHRITHIFLSYFPILLPYESTELVHAVVNI